MKSCESRVRQKAPDKTGNKTLLDTRYNIISMLFPF